MGSFPLRPALTLTEEELLVLTHRDLGVVPPRVALPRDADQAELVLSVAARSLMARGLVLPEAGDATSDDAVSTSTDGVGSTDDEGDDWMATDGAGRTAAEGAAWIATEPLGLTLLLRHTAPSVLALQRALGARPDQPPDRAVGASAAVRYLHLHHDIAVVEDVTPEGMHSLLTVPAARYEEAVADFIVPPDAQPGAGLLRTLGDGSDAVSELLAALGHPTVLVEAAVRQMRSGDPAQREQAPSTGVADVGAAPWMLALGPGGTFCSRDSRTYHPVSPSQAVVDLLLRATPPPEPTGQQQ